MSWIIAGEGNETDETKCGRPVRERILNGTRATVGDVEVHTRMFLKPVVFKVGHSVVRRRPFGVCFMFVVI